MYFLPSAVYGSQKGPVPTPRPEYSPGIVEEFGQAPSAPGQAGRTGHDSGLVSAGPPGGESATPVLPDVRDIRYGPGGVPYSVLNVGACRALTVVCNRRSAIRIQSDAPVAQVRTLGL